MKLLATLSGFLLSGVVAATPLHNIVVFGDSLSDNGNLYDFMKRQLPQSPPYYQGRFTDGPVWIEHLVNSYFPKNASSHLLDYAFGGAGVSEEEDDVLFTLKKEVEAYLISHDDKASPDSLFVVWIGANNYLGLPEEAEQALMNVNEGITHSLQHLVEKGAKHILVLNLPDLGKTPAAVEFNAADIMTYFSKQHNEALRKSVLGLKENYPEVQWVYFDLGKMFDDVLDHPAEYGLTNTTGTCSNSEVDELSKKSFLRMVAAVKPKKLQHGCEGYLFFDLVHPTGAAHQVIAEKVKALLDESGVSFVSDDRES